MTVLRRFEEITGYEASYFYMVCAFFVAIVLAYLLFITMKSAWFRVQAKEMDVGDMVEVIGRALMLLIIFIWIMS